MTTAPALTQPSYLPALTGIRAVAAYLVFWHHHNPLPAGTFGHQLVHQGYIGVSIFFVLSGFLIYYRYASANIQSGHFWRTYLRNRLARLMPLYWVLLLLTFAVWFIIGKRPLDWQLIGLNLTLLKGFSDETKFSGIAQSWSLSVEWTFYILVLFLFIAFRRIGPIWLTIGLWTLGFFCWHNLPFLAFYTFFGRAFEFIVGMWLAHRWQQPDKLFSVRQPFWWAAFIISICVIGQAVCQDQLTNVTFRLWAEIGCYNLMLPIGIGVLFIALLQGQPRWLLFVQSPFWQALGRGSYAFYLIHLGVINDTLTTLWHPAVWIKFILLVLIAQGLYRWVEQPMRTSF